MKSTIKIDFADSGNGLQPVIKVQLIDSDDTRDSLLKAFFQQLGGESSWLSVQFHNNIIDAEGKIITLHPIHPCELYQTVLKIQALSIPSTGEGVAS